MRLRWKILIAIGACLALALAWLLVPRHAHREQVLEAAWAEERSVDARLAHVTAPLPGTFGEMLEPHLSALHDSYEELKRAGPAAIGAVARIYRGEEPISRLGPEVSRNLVVHRAAMLGALQATHTRFARPPSSLRLFSFFQGSGEPFLDVQQAARLAALDVLGLLEQGRADEAVEECADALALGRDVSYPMVLGRMVAVAMTTVSAYGCSRSFSAASAGAVERVRGELFAIRRGTPRFADILRREWVFGRLSLAGPDPRLPEGARVFVAGARNQSRTAFDRLERALFRTTAFDGLEAQMKDFIDAQRLDWPSCVRRMEEVTQGFEWNPLLRQASEFVPLLRRHRDGLLRVDALACAASLVLERARTGALPWDGASACPLIEPQATCGEQGASMRIVDDGHAAHVAVTLSDGSEFVVPLARTVQGSAAALR